MCSINYNLNVLFLEHNKSLETKKIRDAPVLTFRCVLPATFDLSNITNEYSWHIIEKKRILSEIIFFLKFINFKYVEPN